ncbi:TauD/TfdA family dioxygenase [Antribacter sp. KLBMP9083]|uniref:TauD/TfdA family dioxygenase n=2 Tax=Antribacter soli TaxID=2910976 RepID=A0AA41QGH3_9MICO|nr:TauD/TfdA family dioxygenase [Antribacter soli]
MGHVAARVQDRGLVVLPQVTTSEFAMIVSGLGRIYPHPDGDADGRTTISPSGRRGEPGPGFTVQALGVHTDRSSLPVPPRFLGMHLVRHDASTGGFPLFADLELLTAGLSDTEIASLWIERQADGVRLPFRLGPSGGFRYRDDDHFRLAGPAVLVAEVRRRAARITQTVDWLRSGDAYVIDNHRVAHGRTRITDPSRVGVRILAYSPDQTEAEL